MLSHALENKYGDNLSRVKYNHESGHYWKTSLYYYQISKYLKYFNKSQLHILTLESLKDNRLTELNKVFQFLNVQELNDQNLFNYIKNDADSKEVPIFIKSHLWYRLIKKLSAKSAANIAKQLIRVNHQAFLKKPKLKSIIDKNIVEIVRNDALKLEKEFNVDISSWNLNPRLE